ncbi:flagellar basal-body rod protein FlgB [Chryseomicrobium aureum]|uniref:flagellar basal body rod protein FlgB n=1 Tax=Chryseomicrobium aureum TaxID=1441723 RepID=UPI00195EBD5F|nr:flagellar basal body rod protein FlgB [Chryseomicrobium aureum]MBM7705983.1 flagellar basal-body rod protein FlgB [Chryseomicrobium aureum]
MNLFSPIVSQLENGIHTAALKQKTHASNIANVDTPNYKAQKVSFKTNLDQHLQSNQLTAIRTNSQHLSFSNELANGLKVEINQSTQRQPNGNNVDIDVEMAEIAKNQLWYNALTERINGKFSSLRSVINDGK